ncbi:uncharacterized protein V1516DRAFT_713423 [Lipomyces oligophaga]|uniref:uncharacterized protein n=1 Tax=Lipomyces oligophaga TaxID=45792 RepID=UPI0034CEE0AB
MSAQRIYTSPYGKFPICTNSIAEFLLTSPHLDGSSDKTLYSDVVSKKTLTVSQHYRFVRALSATLRNHFKVKPGTVVGLLIPNDICLPALHHAILWNLAVISPVNIAYTQADFIEQMKTAKASLIIAKPGPWLKMATASQSHVPTCAQIVNFDDLVHDAFSHLDRGSGTEGDFLPLARPASQTLAYLCFSSGTTGKFKGVMTSHSNMTNNVLQTVRAGYPDLYSTNGVYAGILPETHIYGLQGHIHVNPYICAHLVIFPQFEFETMLKAIVEFKITHINIVPPIMVLLSKSALVDKYPQIRNSLKVMISGAAPLSHSLAMDVQERIGGKLVVCQGYGMTEATPITHMSPSSRPDSKAGSIGLLVPNMEARLVDPDTDEDVEPGTPGELLLRGPNVMMGYLENIEATKATLINDGWLKTGDIVVIDNDGYYAVVDRSKELIKSKGFQVAPAELEALLLRHPQVIDAAVVGHWSEAEATEQPRAFVVIAKGTQIETIHRWVDEQVAKHKRLHGGIVEVDQIPKSPSGKILRRLLKDRKDCIVSHYRLAAAKL